MTTLMAYSNSEGTRRCDARCHEGRHAKCLCICGGRYHGRGFHHAQEQLTRDVLGDNWRETLGIHPEAKPVERML